MTPMDRSSRHKTNKATELLLVPPFTSLILLLCRPNLFLQPSPLHLPPLSALIQHHPTTANSPIPRPISLPSTSIPLPPFFPFVYLGPHQWHMEVPRLGIKSELQLPAYTIATAMPDLSCI